MKGPLSLAALGGLAAHYTEEARKTIEYGWAIGLYYIEMDQVARAWLDYWRDQRMPPDFHQLREAFHACACDRPWRPPA